MIFILASPALQHFTCILHSYGYEGWSGGCHPTRGRKGLARLLSALPTSCLSEGRQLPSNSVNSAALKHRVFAPPGAEL